MFYFIFKAKRRQCNKKYIYNECPSKKSSAIALNFDTLDLS